MSDGGETIKKKYAMKLYQNEVQYRVNTLKKTIDKVVKILKWQKGKDLKYPFSETEITVSKDALPILKQNLKRFEMVFSVMKKTKQRTISDSDFSIRGLNYKLFNLVNKSINHKYILNYLDKHPKAELTVDGVFYSPILLKSFEDEMPIIKEMINEADGGQKDVTEKEEEDIEIEKEKDEKSDRIKLDLTKVNLSDVEKQAIKEVLTLQRYNKLTKEEGIYLFNSFSDYESLLNINGKILAEIKYSYGSSYFTKEESDLTDEKLKSFLENIYTKKYINIDDWEGTIEPNQITIDFVNSVKGRLETLGYRKIGADLFPEIDTIIEEDNSIEELRMLIELIEDTLKDNPNNEDLEIYLELLKDTLDSQIDNGSELPMKKSKK